MVYTNQRGSDLESTYNLCVYLKQSDKNFLEKKRFSFVVISTATWWVDMHYGRAGEMVFKEGVPDY